MKHIIFTSLFVLAVLIFTPQSSWSQVDGIDGTWYFGEKPLTVEVYDGGWRLSVTNEAGNKAHGKGI